MEAGKTHYDSGQFSEALQIWKKAQQTYEATGDALNNALASNFVSLAAQELGYWEEAEKAINLSLSLLETGNEQIRAQILNTQGRLQFVRGKAETTPETWQDATETALETWREAETLYKQAGDQVGVMGSKINQIQAMQALGLYRQARKIFAQIEQNLEQQPNSRLKVTGLRTLGNLLRQSGELQASKTILEQALVIAEELKLNQEKTAIILSLGNTTRAQKDIAAALKFYQEAQATAINILPLLQLQAQLNQLSLLVETQQWSEAESFGKQIPEPLSILHPSRSTIYAQINLAKNLICLKIKHKNPTCTIQEETKNNPSSSINNISDKLSWSEIISLLNNAIQKSEEIQDKRVQSYALGNLGQLYENQENWQNAHKYTEKALNLAQQIQAVDIAYQWQWQLGRLLKQKGNIKEAIAAYSQAVKSLKYLRSDLVTLNPDIQFDFREEVEPVYRELVDLLLQKKNPEQQELKQAREVIEALQLAELNNFFRDACLQAKPEQLDEIVDNANTPTAAIYAIVLSNRLEVIVKLPKKPDLLHYRTEITQTKVEQNLAKMRQELSQPKPSTELFQLSQQVYNWLLRQPESDLKNSNIETLVFVLDFSLQNIPLAALDDGKKYLVEKYAIALSPGLQLLKPKSLNKININVLAAGVSEKRALENRIFERLNNVLIELQQIGYEIPSSEELLNSSFIEKNLRQKIKSFPFSVIHIATHGNFSSNPEDTFILLWDELLKAKKFDRLLRISDTNQPYVIELLILSACQTAEGDKRATLGLAGVAVRAGARSTLATLWQVDDISTANLMIKFYQELRDNPTLTKAEALRRAQKYLLEKHPNTNYKLPYYWAPFVLIGNWL
ncbi:MAG: CHAT domain-containing protein [Moorea sp. SIO2B7]|nr:CHAT domain-containing protein [Moorena sp. SIO2B7]